MNSFFTLLFAALLSIHAAVPWLCDPSTASAEYKRSGNIREILPPEYKRSGLIREILSPESDPKPESPAASDAEPPLNIKPPVDGGAENETVGTKAPAALEEDVKLMVKTLAGNIRREPSLEGRVIAVLYRGDIVSLVDRQGEWSAVRLHDGRTGWAHRSLFRTPEPDVLQTADTEWLLKSIRIVLYSKNEERLFIELNGFSPPEVLTIPGDLPTVVCDFPKTRSIEGLPVPVAWNGGLIRQVSVRANGSTTRVVVSLSKTHEYDIQQIFYSADNVYSLIFSMR